MSHDAAINSIICTLPSLIASLERDTTERSEPAAEGLAKFVKTYYFITCAHLLHHILPHISHMSLIFQKEHVDVSLIQPALDSTIQSIRAYRTANIPQEVDAVIEGALQGFKIKDSETERERLRDCIQMKYVDAVIKELEIYFPNSDEYNAFTIFDPSKLPSVSFDTWGLDKLAILEDKYGNGDNPDIDCSALESEWKSIKHFMSRAYRNTDMRSFLKLLVSDATLKDLFPQMSRLASIALILPVSTAECERCFSAMNRIKANLRNRLQTSTLCQLITISVEGMPLEHFEFEKAASIRGSMNKRRISVIA